METVVLAQTKSAEGTKRIASVLASLVEAGDVVLLNGDLGAGKTQFSQGLAAALGVTSPVTSPTFNILLEYHEGRIPLYHFDLYRLEDEIELEDIGFYDIVEDEGVSLIEWADKFPQAVTCDYVEVNVRIAQDADGTRTFEATPCGPRGEELLVAWQEALAE